MVKPEWEAVDRFFAGQLDTEDAGLEEALRASERAGLPPISVSPAQGKLLHLLARMRGARAILEIGTLGGYSTIWLARALPPGGRLVTLEVNPDHARVARANLARAGVAERVELREGEALDTLAALEREGAGPFDFVFVDADKPATPDYFRWAMRLCAPGAAIVVDNVVRAGRVADGDSEDASVRGVRRLAEVVGAEPRVNATVVQTVGSKSYDGFLLAVVEGEPGR